MTHPADRGGAAFELKGTVSTMTVLRLSTADVARIEAELARKVAQLPHFFVNAPVVLDFELLADQQQELPLRELADVLRRHQMVPVAVRNLDNQQQQQRAREAGFGLLKAAPRPAPAAAAAEQPLQAPGEASAAAAPSAGAAVLAMEPVPGGGMLVTHPVRAGQVIYAQQTDLVVTSPVNAGAEVIADGNVHVYAPLRGRALAGAHGNESARIFCASLEAELVSIAGQYLMADEIPDDRRGHPAQVRLVAGSVVIEAL